MKAWIIALTLGWIPVVGLAQSDLIQKESAHGVSETLDRLEDLAGGKGMTVFARIDHRANATAAGLELTEAQVLVFGAPQAGTGVMTQDPRAGLDLPLRVLAYRDADGRTWMLYHDPRRMTDGYALSDTGVLGKMAGILDQLTNAAGQ